MADPLGEGFRKDIEKYNPFHDDYRVSRELLEFIQHCNRSELDQAGFTTHFIDALKDEPYLDPSANILVKQTEKETRTIWAVLRQRSVDGTMTALTRKVGEEMDGMRLPSIHFTDEDLELAISQLDDLQQMRNLGMISIDRTLSFPEWLPMRRF